MEVTARFLLSCVFITVCLSATSSKVIDVGNNKRCFNTVNYKNENGIFYGIINVSFPLKLVNTLDVEFQVISHTNHDSGKLHLLSENKDNFAIKKNHNVLYKLDFPKWKVQPKITKVFVNKELICEDDEIVGPSVRTLYQSTIYSNEDAERKIEDFASSSSPNVFHDVVKRQVNSASNPNPLSFLQATCGTSFGSNQLIFGGRPTEKGKFPWVTALFVKTKGKWKFQCGASLVTYTHLISAAHCMEYQGTKRSVSPPDMKAMLGVHDLTKFPNEPGAIVIQVKTILVNPGYQIPVNTLRSGDNDIAIVMLERSIQTSQTIRPICLWPEDSTTTTLDGTMGLVTGWGLTEDGALSSFLKEIDVPIVSEATCLRSHEAFRYITSDKTFCAGSRNGKGPCSGDSGSGLMVKRDMRMYLTGVVSVSVSNFTTQSCDLDQYVVYANVIQFRTWINDALAIPARDLTVENTTPASDTSSNSCEGKSTESNSLLLLDAINADDLKTIEALLKNCTDPNTRSSYHQQTALMLATKRPKTDVLKLLLKNGADVNGREENQWTVLQIAANNGATEHMKILVENGAEVNAVNKYNWTALMYAVQFKSVDGVNFLLEKGADANARDFNKWSVLMIAAEFSTTEIVQILLKKNAYVNASGVDGKTALTLAAQRGPADKIKALLDGGAAVNPTDYQGWNPLCYAVRYGTKEMIKLLLDAGGDVTLMQKMLFKTA